MWHSQSTHTHAHTHTHTYTHTIYTPTYPHTQTHTQTRTTHFHFHKRLEITEISYIKVVRGSSFLSLSIFLSLSFLISAFFIAQTGLTIQQVNTKKKNFCLFCPFTCLLSVFQNFFNVDCTCNKDQSCSRCPEMALGG